MSEGTDQVIKFVEDAVHDFHQEMPLLRIIGCHQQGKDVCEERACSEFTGIDGDLPKSTFPHLRIAVFDLEQEGQDFPLLLLLDREFRFNDILEERCKELVFFRLDGRKIS